MPDKILNATKHPRNIQVLMTELFKIVNNLVHPITGLTYLLPGKQYYPKTLPKICNRGKSVKCAQSLTPDTIKDSSLLVELG